MSFAADDPVCNGIDRTGVIVILLTSVTMEN